MNDTVKRSKGSAINRVLEIIELISVSERPLAPADLAFTLDIPKPSIHRLLQQLEEDGFVRTDWRGQIVPGARLVKTAVGALSSRVQENMRQSVLQRLAAEVGETCGIAIPRDMEMLYTDRVQSNWPLQIYLPVGVPGARLVYLRRQAVPQYADQSAAQSADRQYAAGSAHPQQPGGESRA
ncbi:Acetate operon repressor [Pluralibacter gergoviae]|nr:Acetate operon repressor [Pluralibacter gergoviae]